MAIHGPTKPPSVRVSMDADRLCPSMNHLKMDTFPTPLGLGVHGYHMHLLFLSVDHPRMGTLPTPSVRVSVDAVVTMPIHGPSTAIVVGCCFGPMLGGLWLYLCNPPAPLSSP